MRRSTLAAAILAAAAALAAASARAATLHTAPLLALDAGDGVVSLYCQIRNVGAAAAAVTIESIAFDGTVASDVGPLTVAPGQAVSHLAGSAGFLASCRFTVSGNAKRFRAVALYYDGTAYTFAIPAR
jgi:hypothetical protein